MNSNKYKNYFITYSMDLSGSRFRIVLNKDFKIDSDIEDEYDDEELRKALIDYDEEEMKKVLIDEDNYHFDEKEQKQFIRNFKHEKLEDVKKYINLEWDRPFFKHCYLCGIYIYDCGGFCDGFYDLSEPLKLDEDKKITRMYCCIKCDKKYKPYLYKVVKRKCTCCGPHTIDFNKLKENGVKSIFAIKQFKL
jgi:hypothetical protein